MDSGDFHSDYCSRRAIAFYWATTLPPSFFFETVSIYPKFASNSVCSWWWHWPSSLAALFMLQNSGIHACQSTTLQHSYIPSHSAQPPFTMVKEDHDIRMEEKSEEIRFLLNQLLLLHCYLWNWETLNHGKLETTERLHISYWMARNSSSCNNSNRRG